MEDLDEAPGAEIEAEIASLERLEALAGQIRRSGADTKWRELSNLLAEIFTPAGLRTGHQVAEAPAPYGSGPIPPPVGSPGRKPVLFTEHRDTLDYLQRRIGTLLGRPGAVTVIHGGVGREERRKAQEAFLHDRRVQALIATDAAGEGIDLQRAHLMVNYDLPWNPNRLEQRFGRIHRIGRAEVCHLWNLVAAETREGDVYRRLLDKLEQARHALGGQVFDVLGKLEFEGRRLRDLLIEAVRYGDRPEVRARLSQAVGRAVDRPRLETLIEERALAHDAMDSRRVARVREDMERAEARRLQPHYVESFFLEAFRRLGGTVRRREPRRYEITHVPAPVRSRDRQAGVGEPAPKRYERIAFDKALLAPAADPPRPQPSRARGPAETLPASPSRPEAPSAAAPLGTRASRPQWSTAAATATKPEGAPRASSRQPPAAFVCPGHPLLDAGLDLTLERGRGLLQRGAFLVDERDPGGGIRVLFTLEHAIRDGSRLPNGEGRTISRPCCTWSSTRMGAGAGDRDGRGAPARLRAGGSGSRKARLRRREPDPRHGQAPLHRGEGARRGRGEHHGDEERDPDRAQQAGGFILAIVVFPPDEGEPRVRHVRDPFEREPDFRAVSVNYELADLLARSEAPRRRRNRPGRGGLDPPAAVPEANRWDMKQGAPPGNGSSWERLCPARDPETHHSQEEHNSFVGRRSVSATWPRQPVRAFSRCGIGSRGRTGSSARNGARSGRPPGIDRLAGPLL